MKKNLLFTILLFSNFILLAQLSPILPAGSNWKYLDNGSNQGTSWISTTFNDASWATGNAELGYGDGDETTSVSYGPSPSNKYITTYFRKTFTVSNPSQFYSLNLEVVRDDGAVVYINGTEVWRDNMPSGVISSNTMASSAIALGSESAWNQVSISSTYLVAGNNTIAVEIHQESGGSSDISFNLKLDGNLSPSSATVDRGPYLNTGTPTSMIIKWRTTQATDTKIYYGASFSNLNQIASSPQLVTNHEIKITGLNPATVYYYKIGSSGVDYTSASADYYFKTSPIAGTKGNYKFWVVGDAGMGDNNQRNAKTGFMNYISNAHIDGWLWCGDNAYDNGYDSQYQSNVFSNNTYENELKKFVVWPAPGNHDYNNHIPFSPSPAYYDIFTLPKAAEAGGLASGTEKYYSYNYGNIHFVVLDSYDEGRNTTDPMVTWLTADLAANTLPWTIAYWHHPPYTKGSHNSDNSNFLDGELVDIRQNIIPIIENAGVDLVLNGHSHCYERSFLMDGHYGNSGSLQASMKLDNTSGSYPASCPYQKQTDVSKSHKGTVYTVCGSSGKLGSTSSGWPHPAMYSYSNTTLGSMLLEVNDNRLDAKFINANGQIFDSYTIVKNAGKTETITSCPGDNITLIPSWPSSVQWFPLGVNQDSVIVNPMVSTVYYAYDPLSCIRDTFIVNMDLPGNCSTVGIQENNINNEFILYPNVINSFQDIVTIKSFQDDFIEQISIIDINGRRNKLTINESSSSTSLTFQLKNYSAGIYLIEIKLKNERIAFKKIIIAE